MARPIKIGLDYFSVHIDFFTDIKIKKMITKLGNESVSVYLYLLTLIYQNSYFIQIDEDTIFIISNDLRLNEVDIEKHIKTFTELGIFNKSLYDNFQVLTNEDCQIQYDYATQRRLEVTYIKELLLINPKPSDKTSVNVIGFKDAIQQGLINVDINSINVDISTHIDSNRDKDNYIETNNKTNVTNSNVHSDECTSPLDSIISLYQEFESILGKLGSNTKDDLKYYCNKLSYEVVEYALYKTINKKGNFGYAKAMLEEYERNEVTTYHDILENQQEHFNNHYFE